ncbi:MAG: BlaI/MecI/CopY family transcriptional regulator [Eubacteriales bacterium]
MKTLGEPLGQIESKFADMIWDHEPIPSGELVKLCAEELNWKKSTTFSVLKKFCERGLFQNQKAVVTSLVSREEFKLLQSKQFLEHTYSGSLPQLFAAFVSNQSLSEEEAREIQEMINRRFGD